jgi:hypothetical protein
MILHPAQPVDAIPINASGQMEATKITPIALTGGVGEVQTVTSVAFASHGQGDYFTFANAAGEIFAVWLDKDADGTAPTGAAYVASDYQIEVDIVTGDADTVVATKVRAAVILDADFLATDITITRADAVLTFTHANPGNITASGVHNTGDTGAGGFTTATTVAGVSPNLNSKYFICSSDATNYYVWFNVNGLGSDPSVASKTAIPVALTGLESLVQLAAAAAAEIEAISGLNSEADGSGNIMIYNDIAANVLNAGAGNSGFTVNIAAQGVAAVYSPSYNVGSLSNAPTVISAGS